MQNYNFVINEFEHFIKLKQGGLMKKICTLITLLLYTNHLHSMNRNHTVPLVTVVILPTPLGYQEPPIGTVYSTDTSQTATEISGLCIVDKRAHIQHQQQQMHNLGNVNFPSLTTQAPHNQHQTGSFNFTSSGHDYHAFNDDNHETTWYWQCTFCECCLWLCCHP